MNVLILGASGLIGSRLMPALRSAGCTVTGAGRRQPDDVLQSEWRSLDFAELTTVGAWIPHLAGVDAVVNCVGIFRESQSGDFDRLHRAAPIALFAACELLGIRRLVHISVLGCGVDAATEYWRSKGAAEADLLERPANPKFRTTVVRPSLVYGADGLSSRMFLTLATLPLLALPLAHSARVQPIHVDDLVELLVKLVMSNDSVPREIAAVGPCALTMADYLAQLRRGMDAPPAVVLDLPLPLARQMARLAALHPASVLTPDALIMLAGANTADAGPVAEFLERAPREPDTFAKPEQRPAAVLAWGLPLARMAVAALWLITAAVSWFAWPHAESSRWLAACGIPADWRETTLLAASLADAAIGIVLVVRPRHWLWPLQIALVGGYTVVMSACLPQFWLHPFGLLSKNLPILALMAIMWRLEGKRN
ncbi:SDR family oxidoreductase [Paraherbaspirillum soli]|uniref:SDR family oxidoreductase n=1 Tax=Paraherbaspirillum soli TaxID=631222 RepID=A0ABW0M811_9BURK